MKPRLYRRTYSIKDTKGIIISDQKSAINIAKQALKKHRKDLEKYCELHPQFRYSLKPLEAINAPISAKLMALAGKKAGVGPMAAVAGVLADLAVDAMLKDGAQVAVLENGGEVSMASNRPINVAVAAGEAELSRKIGFRVKDFPVGIATSSGRHSHALSFGDSDAVTVFAENAGLADAAATMIGNQVKSGDTISIENALHQGSRIHGVKGLLVLIDGNLGTYGKLPQLLNLKDST